MTSWSPQQEQALTKIQAWIKDRRGQQIFRLFGFAGTGKTTLAREIESMSPNVLYATFTGKASLVLRSKGCENASTIHSLIYKVTVDSVTGKPRFVLNRDSALARASVLVLDEVSMVGEELARDLMSFGKKILALGDPFQLPPVKDAGFFTNAEPDFMLTEIHRQAADNPIIRMSMDIREGRGIALGGYGDSAVIERAALTQKRVLAADQVLCGLNNSRRQFNSKLRNLKGIRSELPVEGDRLVCLKNNRDSGLLNGGIWNAAKAEIVGAVAHLKITPDSAGEGPNATDVKVPVEFFTGKDKDLPWQYRRDYDEFDYGYALTVHKSQGSQWPSVVLFDESRSFRDEADRWLYTGVTRAAETVLVVR